MTGVIYHVKGKTAFLGQVLTAGMDSGSLGEETEKRIGHPPSIPRARRPQPVPAVVRIGSSMPTPCPIKTSSRGGDFVS